MVVFGAGASYDSCPTHAAPLSEHHGDNYRDCRLPLGDNLFEERDLFFAILERFPRALDVVPRLRHLPPKVHVEQVMETLTKEGEKDSRRHRQLAAVRYYLQSAIGDCESHWERRAAHGVSNYKSLLDMIEHRREPDQTVCLVTFNYDTLLDAALPTVGIELRSIADYIGSDSYKVIKVHGSINWGREVEPPIHTIAALGNDQLMHELIEKAASLQFTKRFHLLHQRPMVRLDETRPAIPAIAIPVRTKGAFECPDEHIDALKECLSKVTKLLVIGWRANDDHFLKLLKEALQGIDTWVVAGSAPYANEVIENLKKGLDQPRKFQAGEAGFTHFMLHDAATFLDSF